MSDQNVVQSVPKKTILVYCVVRYGQLLGCYSSQDDAMQIVSTSVAKGQLCDLIIKPLLWYGRQF